MSVTSDFVERITGKWKDQAPQFWWGDRLDARFLAIDKVRRLDGLRVADIGCNAGVVLSEVAATSTCVGVDLSAEALELAGRIAPAARLIRGNVLDLPVADASVDAVLFFGMLEMLHGRDKERAFREVTRILRPGGRLILTTPNRRYPRYRNSAAHDAVDRATLENLLRDDFEFELVGFNPFPPFPRFLPNRMLARLPGIWAILQFLADRNIGTDHSCMFVVDAVKKQQEAAHTHQSA